MVKIQSSVIRGVFELCDASGNEQKKIPYSISLSKINLRQIDALQAELANAHKDNDLKRLGKIVMELFAAILGENTVAELVDYYQEDYVSLLADLSPFLSDEVFPALDRINKKLVDGHKRGKR